MAIFRGTGGQGDSTTDTTVTTVTQKAAEAASSATSAATSATSAANSASSASTSETNAATSETNAATSATASATSATASETAKTASEAAQTAAETAEANAETAEANAVTAKNQAVSAKDNAVVAQTAAETAETNAETAYADTLAIFGDAQDVQDAVDSASASATTATTKAAEAATSATNAANSATSAGTSETNAASSASSAATSAASANSYATDAQTAQTAAETAQAAAEASEAEIKGLYLGSLADDPTLDGNGVAVTTGDLYFNTTAQEVRVYTDGDVWEPVVDLGGDVTVNSLTSNNDVVVKGNLEVQGTTITVDSATAQTIDLGDNDRIRLGDSDDLQVYHDGTDSYIANTTGTLKLSGNTDVTGNITVSGTVDGRDVATDGSKLDNIEENADVTDTANVTAAGALMDSEVTNLAQVKAFDSADYATAAQGTTADNALPTAGGTLTGDLAFGDDVKAKFGDSDDLQIYHDEVRSLIVDQGTGPLRISATNLEFTNAGQTKFYANATDGGAFNLYHNHNQKLATTSSGVDITGTVVADGLTVDGDVLLDKTATGANTVLINASSGNNSRLVFCEGNTTPKYNIGFLSSDASFTVYHSAGNALRLKLQNNGDISFYDDAGTSQDFYWDASTSRLGLGTTSPFYQLHVKAQSNASSEVAFVAGDLTADGTTASSTLNLNSTARAGGTTRFQRYQLVLTPDSHYGHGSLKLTYRNDGINYPDVLKVNSSGDVIFYAQDGTTEAFYWDKSTSRLGLGTTSPASLLHLEANNPTLQIKDTSRTSSLFINADYASAGIDAIRSDINNLRLQTDSNTSIQFVPNGSEVMRVVDGKVGIGTTSPASAYAGANNLVIGGGSGEAGLTIYSSTTTDGNIYFADGTTAEGAAAYRGYLEYRHSSNYFRIGVNGSEAMRIDSSGRLGIGTTNPQATLQVSSGSDYVRCFDSSSRGIQINQADPILSLRDSDATGTPLCDISGSGGILSLRADSLNETASSAIQFTVDGSEAARIDSSGNLLVGTTSTTVGSSSTLDGIALLIDGSGGTLTAARSGTVARLNRQSSDGEIINFRKDGTTVGSIGTFSDDAYIATNDTGLRFIDSVDAITPFNGTTVTNRDAAISLGLSSYRFTDLYLSGDVISDGSVTSNVDIKAETGTTYTTVLTDRSKLVTLDNASAVTVTIPPNSSVAYPTGTKIDLLAKGAGQVTVAAGAGVTVNSAQTLKLRAQWSAASVVKLATDTWVLVGDLEAS